MACICEPDSANAAPATTAVSIRGSRSFHRMASEGMLKPFPVSKSNAHKTSKHKLAHKTIHFCAASRAFA